jgi:DNA-binding NarL/FixJ family response regulator
VRLILADDSVLFREGLARVLAEVGFEIVAQAGDGQALLRELRAHPAELAIVDIRMPPTHTVEGLVAARQIREEHRDVNILVLSQYVETEHALALLELGTDGIGYLLKDRVSDLAAFADVVRRVGDGGSAIDPSVVAQLVGR